MASFLTTLAVFRSAPLVASVALHAGLAAGVVVGFGGHRAPSAAVADATEIDVSLAAPEPAPVAEPEAPAQPELTKPAAVEAKPTHTHDYPVPPSHDAHDHDPSIVHDHDAPPAPAAEPAPAAPAITSDAVLPKFDLSVGGAPVAAHVVSTSGTGAGDGAPAAPAPAAEIVAESAVSVPATLAARAVAAYPPVARAGGLEADVPLEIVVDTSGAVLDARLLARAGSGFDESALAAIRRYRFTPAQRHGHTVRVRMKWSVQFRLQ